MPHTENLTSDVFPQHHSPIWVRQIVRSDRRRGVFASNTLDVLSTLLAYFYTFSYYNQYISLTNDEVEFETGSFVESKNCHGCFSARLPRGDVEAGGWRPMCSQLFLVPSSPLPSPPQCLLPSSYRPSHSPSPLSQDVSSDNRGRRVEIKCRCGWLWVRVCDRGLPAFTHQPPSCVTARCTGGRQRGQPGATAPVTQPCTVFLTPATTISTFSATTFCPPLPSCTLKTQCYSCRLQPPPWT